MTDAEQAEAVVDGLTRRDWDDGSFKINSNNVAVDTMRGEGKFDGRRYGQFIRFKPGNEEWARLMSVRDIFNEQIAMKLATRDAESGFAVHFRTAARD